MQQNLREKVEGWTQTTSRLVASLLFKENIVKYLFILLTYIVKALSGYLIEFRYLIYPMQKSAYNI